MSNPIKALNEHFYYNTRLAKALQQLLNPSERKMIQTWFDKLIDMDKTTEQMVIRSDYMWFILLMLQSKKIREPFNKLPPPQLVPLKKFVPLHVYEDVLILNEPNMVYIDRRKKRPSLTDDSANTTSCSTLDQHL
ncbi:uncharacterized protein LOC108904369 [Anoplophora glabripennis]|uniref:uncharacterized protein LOC108904369 n=1 Tax=Anoplophora glabripennis TaxID=217634 RepID=UPI000873CC6F|nr:uncharacterized protein LOC108904369 [Anoplophora glabripennis]